MKASKIIAGVDEVGRGSLIGSVYSAAVILPDHGSSLKLKDSKKLSPKKREEIFSMVEENNIEYSFNESSNTFIDKFGIKNANEKVLTDSISDIYTGNEIVYVDHFKINNFKSISVVRGEDNCRAIALASIIAKVLRDNLMIKFSEKYPEYSFEKNKGYGTKDNREAISKYGLSNFHRKSFNLHI